MKSIENEKVEASILDDATKELLEKETFDSRIEAIKWFRAYIKKGNDED